ncbi:MAG: hypothetical protein IH823_08950, partial [Candidatus Dadabacteria bacterium]|nr:hypothetical protein [Candidatus Dadabacteria bacterium]
DKLHDDLARLLKEYNFSTEFNSQIKGKSGNSHKIPIYAINKSRKESIAIFISPKSETVSQVNVNNILISIIVELFNGIFRFFTDFNNLPEMYFIHYILLSSGKTLGITIREVH